MTQDCIFCKIIAGEIPSAKIYENDQVLAFLDISPVSPGHTLVIPKNHSENLIDASEEELKAVIKAVKKIAPAVLKSVGAAGFNLGVNNGKVAGQLVSHLHFHIMPRFEGDGRRLWEGKPYREEEMEEVAEKIRSNL